MGAALPRKATTRASAWQPHRRTVLEWEPLLTTILFDPRENRRVEVDLMAADGHLYRGMVEDHFLDKEGGLRGLLLKDAGCVRNRGASGHFPTSCSMTQ